MKTLRLVTVVVGALALGQAAPAQTFNAASSSWGTGGTFQVGGSPDGGVLLANGTTPNGLYFGSAQPDANTFVFGLTSAANITSTANYNLSGALAAGTNLTLTFSGVNSRPDYIAYTGGALTAYSYNSTAKTLTLSTNTVDPVASASDPTSNLLQSTFGLMIVSGSAHNFAGTVFQTGMFWDDVSPLANYSGTSFLAGVNANGINGQSASFYAYLPTSFLGAAGITEPDHARAVVQKSTGSGTVLNNLSIDIYAAASPSLPAQQTTWLYRGASQFDFNGGGNDDFIVATYTNSSWSDANMGIVVAVPEPATWTALLGSLALLTALRRRRAKNNATMR